MMKYNLLVFVSVNNSQPKPILTELCGRAWTVVISLTTAGCCDFGTTLERIAKILGEIPLNKRTLGIGSNAEPDFIYIEFYKISKEFLLEYSIY